VKFTIRRFLQNPVSTNNSIMVPSRYGTFRLNPGHLNTVCNIVNTSKYVHKINSHEIARTSEKTSDSTLKWKVLFAVVQSA
jgi:hypothetical protein